jgi:hypothetical protein
MGEVIPLFGGCRPRDDNSAAGRPEFDPLTNLLSVTKYWETAITQIGRCQIDLPAQSQKRLKIDLTDLERKLRELKSVLDQHKRSNGYVTTSAAKAPGAQTGKR